MKKLIFTLFTVCSAYAASAQNNVISGNIMWDTMANNAMNANFIVWLIEHDSAANTLTAVDSVQTSGYMASYSFANKPAGLYRTKAAPIAGTVGYTYLLPSYHDSSFYWNTAQVINHTGGASMGKYIWMLQGTPTTGPGFIGGNISAGANKGTGGGIAGIMVALMSSTNQMLKHTFTNANGDYSFSNLPVGTYTVFPEATGYITNEATNVAVTAAAPSVNALDFKQTPTHIKLIPAGIKDVATANLFSLYPNPANSNIEIKFTSAQAGNINISITDVTGRQVLSKVSNGKATEQINVSHLPSGTYFIRLATDKATHTEKLSVKH